MDPEKRKDTDELAHDALRDPPGDFIHRPERADDLSTDDKFSRRGILSKSGARVPTRLL